LQIERQSFKEPYSRAIFEQELKIKAAVLWVVTYRRNIVGYINFWVILDEIELVSIAVHPRYHRRGVAILMMQRMLEFGIARGVQSVVLDVRTSNHAAQSLYRRFGFEKVGLRRAYYSDNREDAIIMKREIP
jgi:ribosomal-protein-alanine N-acetyltransferase